MLNANCLPVACLVVGLALLGGCDSDGGGSVRKCTALAASDYPCTDPNECLSVTATWCFPGARTCSNTDVDLSLELPGGGTIGRGNGEFADANGCVHDGDETGVPINAGGYDENITCNPFVHAQPPDRIDPGLYTIVVQELDFLSTEVVLLDINVNGQTSCQVVDVEAASARVEVMYP